MSIQISGYDKNCLKFICENKEKSAVVYEMTNRFCSIIFQKIHMSGGSVYKFSGGNVTAFFPKEVHSRIVNNCGLVILSELCRLIKSGTKDPLLAKTSAGIGISYGETLTGMFGSAVKEYFITGSTLVKAVSCVNEASRNEQIVSCSMRSRLGMCGFKSKKEGYFISEKLEELFEIQEFEKISYSKIRTETFGGKIVADFEKENKTGKLFSRLSCLKVKSAVKLSDIKQDYKKLNSGISEIIRISQSFGGYISDINVGPISIGMSIIFGITGSGRNCAESAAGCALEIQQAADVFSDTGMSITTGSGFCYAAGCDGKSFLIPAGDFINRNERLIRTVSAKEITIDDASLADIHDASFENERLQGFKGLREKYKIFTLKPFSDKHSEKCGEQAYLEKEEADFEKICTGNSIKQIFIESDELSTDYIAVRLYTVSTKYGKTHLIYCKEETSGFPYYTIKALINAIFDEISSHRYQALESILEDINESQNAAIFFQFLNGEYESRSKNDALKYLFEEIILSVFSYYTEKSKVFVIFSGAEFIDKESAIIIERFFHSQQPLQIKGFFSFIYKESPDIMVKNSQEESRICIRSSGMNENEVTERISGLDENSRAVLSYFSAEGISAEAKTIKKAIGDELFRNGTDFEKCMKQLSSRCILMRVQNRQDNYIFINRKAREKVYSSISTELKKKIHKSLGNVYEEEYLKGSNSLLPKVFNHYIQSDHKVKAREYMLTVCFAALNNFSPETACRIITDAAKLKIYEASDRESSMIRVLIKYFKDNVGESIQICSDIISTSQHGSEIYRRAFYFRLKMLFENGMFNEAAEQSSASVKMQKDDLFVKIMCLKGLALIKIGKTNEAGSVSSSVYEVKNTIKDNSALTLVYELSGTLNLNTGKYKLARAYFEDMYLVAQDCSLPAEKLSALKLISESFEKESDSRKALEALDKLCTESVRLHNFDYAVYCIERFRHNSRGYGNPKKVELFIKRWLDAAVRFKRPAVTEVISKYLKSDSNQYF